MDDNNDYIGNGMRLIDGDIAKTLKVYAASEDISKRQLFGRVLLEILRQPPPDVIKEFPLLIECIDLIAEFKELAVRSSFIKHIPTILLLMNDLVVLWQLASNGKELAVQLYERLLDIVLNGLRDIGPHVRKSANTALCLIIEKYPLEQKQLTHKICSSIEELSKMVITDPQFIDCYTIAIGLMAKSAPFIGFVQTKKYFLDRFLELCDYEGYLVRRACATYFPVFCSVMGPAETETRLLKTFKTLCDDKVWSVRNTCSESLPIVSLMGSDEMRWHELTPIFLNMLHDESRWVSINAYRNIGRFISSFAKPLITDAIYTTSGELEIVNVADEEYRDACDDTIIKNYQYYQQLFQQTLQPPEASLSERPTFKSPPNPNYPNSLLNATELSLQAISHSFLNYVANKKTPLALDRVTWCDKITNMTLEEALPPIKFNLIQEDATNTSFNLNKQLKEESWLSSNDPNEVEALMSDCFGLDYMYQNNEPRRRTQHLKRNTPTDLPSIIVQAIWNRRKEFDEFNKDGTEATENTSSDNSTNEESNNEDASSSTAETPATSNITVRKKKHNFKINVDDSKNLEPPETPTIEDSPTFLTFMSPVPFESNIAASNATAATPDINTNANLPLPPPTTATSTNFCDNTLAVNNNAPPPPFPTIAPITSASTTTSSTNFEIDNAIYNYLRTTGDGDVTPVSSDAGKTSQELFLAALKATANENNNEKGEQFALVNQSSLNKSASTDADDDSNDNTANANNDNDSGVDEEESDDQISESGGLQIDDITDEIINPEEIDIADDDDEDENDAKFNSHQYWYIPPEIPLDMDLLHFSNPQKSEIVATAAVAENNNLDDTLPLTPPPPTLTKPDEFESSSADEENVVLRKKIIDAINIEEEEEEYGYDNSSSNSSGNNRTKEVETTRADLALATLKRDLIMGPFKYTQNILPPELLEGFVSMQQYSLHDLDYFAAYSFPAVILTVGRDNWNFLCNLMSSLCGNRDYKIRQIMAASIYQISLILGRDLTKRDLVPIFVEFFNDLDEVKADALKNFANFLKVIDSVHHDEMVACLERCLESDTTNWRFREELAKQVLELIRMYENANNKRECMLYLTGIAFRLLMDKVNSVRDIAFEAIVVRSRTCTRPEIIHISTIMIVEFATHSHWRRRQSFVTLCHKIMSADAISTEVFSENLLEPLLDLATDPVPNVRLCVGRFLSKTLVTYSPFVEIYARLVEIMRKLQRDVDRDVRDMTRCDQLPPLPIEEKPLAQADNENDIDYSSMETEYIGSYVATATADAQDQLLQLSPKLESSSVSSNNDEEDCGADDGEEEEEESASALNKTIIEDSSNEHNTSNLSDDEVFTAPNLDC